MEETKSLTILIVGGTGVISTAVAAEAHRQGIAVTMINRGKRNLPSWAELIKCDKNDYSTIALHLKGRRFTSVMDFLCYTDEQTTDSFNFYSQYTDQYFFVSSCAVFDKTKPGIKTEDSPKPLKIWSYSVNKYKSEEHLKSIAKDSNCHYTIVRPCVTYGDTRIPYGIMPDYGYHWTLCARILANKPVIRWNGGTTRTNMMRVEDYAVGMVGLIGNPRAYDEDFNICGDEMPSFNEVIEAIEITLKCKAKIIDVTSDFYAKEMPNKSEEILGGRSIDSINSNEKLKSLVPAFKQNISLKDGVKMTINAYQTQDYQHGIDLRFDADTDRIIKKWCKINNIGSKQYNLGFVDYLGNATFHDRMQYWLEFYKESLIVKLIRLVKRIMNR
jgi:nucleoside-diphosphate-sugar epimerase